MSPSTLGLRVSRPGLVGLLLVGTAFGAELPIVYVSRDFTDASQDGPVITARKGALRLALADEVLGSWSSTDLVNAEVSPGASNVPTDVADPDVSHDGQRIIFSGFAPAESAWRIYEVGKDGSGLRQVTNSSGRQLDPNRYGEAGASFRTFHDTDPCYLPDGRICFVSTRYPGIAPGNRRVATNLYVVNADGTDLHRITSERFGADTPVVDPATGQIVYSRWWLTARETPIPSGGVTPQRPPVYYGPVTNPNNFSSTVLRGIDDAAFTGVNNWFLTTIHPDGSEMSQRNGYGLNRELTMAYRPSFLDNGDLLAQFITASPVLAQLSKNGLRHLPEAGGAGLPVAIGGPQAFDGNGLIQDPNPGAPQTQRLEPAFFYHSANGYTGGRLLITGYLASRPDVYEVYTQIPGTAPVKIISVPGRAALDAIALRSRDLPPVIADKAPRLGSEETLLTVEQAKSLYGTFTFKVENIFSNAAVDNRIAAAPPIGRDLTIEFYMNPQRQGTSIPDPPILVGTRPIGPDGKVEMTLPAGVPLFEILRRADGRIAVGRDGQAFHVGGMNFGVKDGLARCVGCHAGHSQMPVPDAQAVQWTNIAPSAVITASSTRGTDPTRGGIPFPPDLLVDRLTDPIASEWAADRTDEAPTLTLRWRQPIQARELIVHGTKTVPGGPGFRDQVISGLTVRQYRGDDLQADPQAAPLAATSSRDVVLAEGTSVSLDPTVVFDVLKISIALKDVAGHFENETGAALSEVEVIGRAAGVGESAVVMKRGDVNCDEVWNVTDSIALLDFLFKGVGTLCCDEAADANGDVRIDLSDAVFIVRFLFIGGDPLLLDCERVTGASLTCEQESCP